MQTSSESPRIRTLDGWRGVAILAVLVTHAAHYSRFNHELWAQLGGTGVDIFFVISGFIITARLLQEGPQIDLIGFYRRRAARILPPVILYLALIAVLARVGALHELTSAELLGSLFFIRNYQIAMHPVGIYTGHFWSLAIEEHFYLLWPGLLALFGSRRALYVASTGATLCALWRYHCMAAADPGRSLYFVVIRTDCRLDGLLIGCCLAILTSYPQVQSWIRHNVPKETPLLCGFPAILLLSASSGLPSLWLYLLVAIAIGSTLFVHQGLAYKWLNLPALVWIGRISYGLYVYQEVFLMHPLNGAHVPRWQTFPVNLILLFVPATASFYFFERPISRLAHRRFAAAQLNAASVTTIRDQEPTYF